MKRLKERVVRLAMLKKRKRLQRHGEVADAGIAGEQAELLDGAAELAPPLLSDTKREPTPELEEIADDVYAESVGAPPPRVVDGLLKYDKSAIYDAALEKTQGAKVPTSPDEQEWDQDFYDSFEAAVDQVNEPLYSQIDRLVRKEAMKNKNRHTEIMCIVESRLQSESLKPLQKLATWFILDALMKQAGGHFVYNIKDNITSLVETFLPAVQINDNWRTRTRDMLRSWRDFFDRKYVHF